MSVTFPDVPTADRLDMLAPPDGRVSMVVDTDAYNEVDDQFAIAHALSSAHDVEAIYAAPFDNDRSENPADGMEKSYDEIERILERLGRSPEIAYRGSTAYLSAPDEPVESEAVDDLVERAKADRDGPLYVVAIGAPTNVASALLADPSIVRDIVVVWLGGQPHDWPSAREFNLQQDPIASKLLFDSGVPLVHVPCTNVAEHVKYTIPELETHMADSGPIGSFLLDRFAAYDPTDGGIWSKEIWDLTCTAYMSDPSVVPTNVVHSPILTSDLTWSRDQRRHFIRVATGVDRDAILRDFVNGLHG